MQLCGRGSLVGLAVQRGCSCARRPPLPRPCPPLYMQGAGVTNTIRSNIADLSYYTQKPDLYMYGMVSLPWGTCTLRQLLQLPACEGRTMAAKHACLLAGDCAQTQIRRIDHCHAPLRSSAPCLRRASGFCSQREHSWAGLVGGRHQGGAVGATKRQRQLLSTLCPTSSLPSMLAALDSPYPHPTPALPAATLSSRCPPPTPSWAP